MMVICALLSSNLKSLRVHNPDTTNVSEMLENVLPNEYMTI